MKKMSKYKNIIGILGITVLMFLFLYKFAGINVLPHIGEAKEYVTTVSETEAKEILELKEGDIYQQTIVATRDEVAGFNIRFGTYEKQVHGKLKISFKEVNSDDIYESMELDCVNIVDNQYHLFVLNPVITDGKDRKYEISIEVLDLEEGERLALYASDDDVYKEGMLTYNGEKISGRDISCQLSGTFAFMLKWYWLVAIIIMLGFVAFAFVTFVKKCSLEYVYLTLGITFGFVYILCFPPYTAPDEGTHISTTYAFASEFLGEEAISPESEAVIFRRTDADVDAGQQVTSQKFQNLYQAIKHPSNYLERNFERGYKLDVPFTCYLPQIIGVVIGMLLKLSGFWTMYLGKLFAMLFFSACIFFSIKLIPWGKMVIMSIALLPMTMELATSYSYDCLLNGLCILFISYALFLICKKNKVTWKDLVFLGVIICVISPCKMFYFLIAGMLFLIPKEKYTSKKAYWLVNTGMLVLGLAVLVIIRFQFFIDHMGEEVQSAIDSANVTYSISSILSDIPHSINVFFNTIIGNSEFYFDSLWGSKLGWFQVAIPSHVITCFVLVIFVAGVCSTREENRIYIPDIRFRLINLGLSLLMFLGILAALWIGWTPVTYQTIQGVQGRYFIPFFPMVVLTMRNRTFLLQKNIDRGLSAVLFAGIASTFLYIIPYIFQ